MTGKCLFVVSNFCCTLPNIALLYKLFSNFKLVIVCYCSKIPRLVLNPMKQFYSFSYVPPLFEIISYSLRKYIINVVVKPSTNLKDLVYKKKRIKKIQSLIMKL